MKYLIQEKTSEIVDAISKVMDENIDKTISSKNILSQNTNENNLSITEFYNNNKNTINITNRKFFKWLNTNGYVEKKESINTNGKMINVASSYSINNDFFIMKNIGIIDYENKTLTNSSNLYITSKGQNHIINIFKNKEEQNEY